MFIPGVPEIPGVHLYYAFLRTSLQRKAFWAKKKKNRRAKAGIQPVSSEMVKVEILVTRQGEVFKR